MISVLFHNCGWSVHPDTVRRWSKQYTGLVHTLVDSLKPSFGTKWSADEKFKKVKGTDYWLFTVMDTTTRFVLSWDVSTKKMTHNATSLLKTACAVAVFRPRIFVTDGCMHTPRRSGRCTDRAGAPLCSIHIRDCH